MSSSSSRGTNTSKSYSTTTSNYSNSALPPTTSNYNSSVALPTAPPPQATLPPLPSAARSPLPQPQPIPSAVGSTYSATGYPPSSPESSHPDPLLRQRGQSSPVTSRHQTRDDWNGTAAEALTMDSGGSSQGRQSRRQSSSTTPRKLVDGREETREERRARKERERALRAEATGEDGASPTVSTRRRSSRSNGLPNSPSGGDDLSQLSLGSPPLAPAATTRSTPSASSKSVLTIALQRAQSAVLLDSANNVPAAISAYTQSVRLLKEVMQRVEEGARREREKEAQRGYDRSQPREGESQEEFARRIAKAERKERAKQDEARRLRVIHDTYEDRIRMLQSVGDPSNELNPPDATHDSSSPSTPSTIHAHSPSAPSSSGFAPELTRRSRSITSLGTVSTPPASFVPLGGPPPTLVLQHPTPGRPEELLSEPAAEIGNAMLANSPPASPMDPKMPNLRPTPSISPLPAHSSYNAAPQRLAPSMARRPSIADETIDEEGDETIPLAFDSRASISSDSTATSMSRAMTLAGNADPSIPFRTPNSYLSSSAPSSRTPGIAIEPESPRGVAAIDLTASPADEEEDDDDEGPRGGGHLPRSESYASSESDDIVPVTAMEYGAGWPREQTDSDVEAEQTEREELSSRASSYGVASGAVSPISMRRSESGQSAEAESMRRGMSGESMQRTASGDSVSALSMRGSSLFGPGGFTQMSNLPPPPLAPVADQPSPRYSTPLVGVGLPSSSRPRPGRSASLANTPTFAVSGSPTKRATTGAAGPPLISPTTHLGTISQRRRSPQPNGLAREADYFGQGEDEEELEEGAEVSEEGHTVQGMPMRGGGGGGGGRPLSAEPSVVSEFGLAPQAAGGFSSASLPTRFRTQSSPRPPLLSSQSEHPNRPPNMLGATSRSFSSSGGYPRKGSIPGTSSGLSMPSTLPLLGRSNSNSSQGSFSETRDSPYSSYAALTQSPSLSHSQSSLPSYTHSSTPSETPTYSSFPRASTSFPGALTSPPPPTASATATAAAASISTIRRPFHLLRQILESLDGQGAYVTPRLFVPPQVWSQAGVKLVALETKVRMLDLLLSGLDSLSKVAVGWSEGRANVKGWNSELESFEGLMEGIQSTLSKKLGYGTGGKKMGSTSFSAWSSKLSRSLDRVANGRSLDKPDVYSEILAKVLRGANVIDLHLDLLATNSGPYSTLSPSDRARIEQRLKRASDFFGQVICRFVMRDVGMLVDKYVKRAGAWLGEG